MATPHYDLDLDDLPPDSDYELAERLGVEVESVDYLRTRAYLEGGL